MKKHRLVACLISGGAGLLLPGMAFGQGPAPGAPGGSGSTYAPKIVPVPETQDPLIAKPLSDQDRTFVETAAARGGTSIAMAQLALARSTDAQVRALAETELTENSRMLGELRQVAERKGMPLATELTPQEQGSILGLHMLHGEEFDRAYVTAVRDHKREAMRLYETERDEGANILVRSYAAKNYVALKRMTEE